jgi:flagellar export protein FliJ
MRPFRLQRVLDERRRREDLLRIRFAAATAARLQAEQVRDDLIDDERRQRNALAVLLGAGRVRAARVQDAALAVDACAFAIERQQEEVERRLRFEHEERLRLAEAMAARKALDKLRERHEERERLEENRRQTALLEEIAAARAARERIAAAVGPRAIGEVS